MATLDIKNLPRCNVDFPLEFTAAEIASIAGPVNTLLKSGYLLGNTRDMEATFQSLFDIAEETVSVDCCAFLSVEGDSNAFSIVSPRHVPLKDENRTGHFPPATIARHFGKPVILDSRKDRRFLPFCEAYSVASLAVFPLRRDRDFIGAVVFGKHDPAEFSAVDIKVLWVLAMQAESNLLQSEAVKALSFYSFLDPLTHLNNRRYFDDQLEKEFLRSRRTGKPFSLLMLDLDGFKNYNDRFLHTAGDIALQEFANILRDCVREVDTVARMGGDEFAVILAESDTDGARDLSTRVIDRFRRHLLPGMEKTRTERLSVSIGVASFPEDSFDKGDLLRKSDRALYMAKNQGGARVCVFQEIADLIDAKPSATDIPLQKIYTAARSVVDMDKFLEILLFTAMQGLSASRGSIVVTDPRGNFTIRAAIGFNNGEERFAPGTSVTPGAATSWVVENMQPLVVGGQQDLPWQQPLKKNGYRTDSFLSLPLIHGGALLGVLHLTNRKDKKSFTREDVSSFSPIVSEIAAILSQGMDFRESIKIFSTSILKSLGSALELRFPFLSGHNGRVRDIATHVGTRMGLGVSDLDSLRTAAELHDIGIVGIPGAILGKKRRLNERELEIARKHVLLGAKLLEGIPGMEEAHRIVLEHHECFDGTGYPYGLRGEEISLGARILGVAEFFDSIISNRPYRGGLKPSEAAQLVKNGGSSQFDPNVSRVFIEAPAPYLPGPGNSVH